MSLHLKYRPDSFESIIGNEELIASLMGLLQIPGTLPHSYLLTGPTGCGKTTIGRILAKEFGCIGSDYREIDSADFRGIDSIREIRKNSQFSPLEGACRVWMIDECHKLTGDAQSALLKILEDTPRHVYFILCTTDPQKLLPTLRGRCTQYQVNLLNDKQMFNLLRKVVRLEGGTLEKEIYDQIVVDAQGHPRNALQTLNQVLQTPVELRLQIARKSAEELSQSIELCRILMQTNVKWGQVNSILSGLKDQDPENIRRAVLGYCQAILLKTDNVRAGLIMEEFIEPFYNSGFPQLVFACYSVIKT